MSHNRSQTKYSLALFIFLLLSSEAVSQPYYFYMQSGGDSLGNLSVYRFDFSTGANDVFWNKQLFRAAEASWDPAQTWLYVLPSYGQASVINIKQPSIAGNLPDADIAGWVDGIFFVPQLERFYVTWNDGGLRQTATFSDQDFTRTGAVENERGWGGILSSDGLQIYYVDTDSTSQTDILYTFSCVSNSVVSTMPVAELGPPSAFTTIEDGRADKLLIRYYYPTVELRNQHYILYDLKTGSSGSAISFPWRGYARVAPDAQRVIIERVDFDTTGTGGEYWLGSIFVFDGATGQLMQSATFFPGGRIFLFDQFPQTLFYLNTVSFQSASAGTAAISSSISLIDSLIAMKHQAVDLGWLRSRRDDDCDEDEKPDVGIVKNLDNRLEKAKRELMKGDSVKSRNELEKFVAKVDRLRKRSETAEKKNRPDGVILSEEGYLLLKTNAGYIVNRFPEREKPDKGRDKRTPKK